MEVTPDQLPMPEVNCRSLPGTHNADLTYTK
jgi:hypothetical protein